MIHVHNNFTTRSIQRLDFENLILKRYMVYLQELEIL